MSFTNFTTTPIPKNLNVKCDAVINKSGSKAFKDTAFSGIPIMVGINVLCFIIIIIIFGILRKYFYQDELKATRQAAFKRYGDNGENLNLDSHDNNIDKFQKEGLFKFISKTIHINDSQIQSKCGSSAVQYLRFQRFLFYLMVLITLFSIVVILPANMSGVLNENVASFARTTIANLSPDSPLIWLHSIGAIIYIIIGIRLMKEFKTSTVLDSGIFGQPKTSVLMFSDLPEFKNKSTKDYQKEIIYHIETAYRPAKVLFATFAFDYNEAVEIYNQILELERKFKTVSHINQTISDIEVNINSDDQFIEQITNQLQDQTTKFENLFDNTVEKRLPLIFVKIDSQISVDAIIRDFNHSLGSTKKSPFYLRLRVEEWQVDNCPIPDDIFWSSLNKKCSHYHILRTIGTNLMLFLLILFFSTPTIVMSNLEQILNYLQITNITGNIANDDINRTFSWIQTFLPSMLLLTFSIVLPIAVANLSAIEGHFTISGCNRISMQRTFWFLICMVTILPSIGLTSFDVLLEKAFTNSTTDITDEALNRFKCIFLPSNGAFFVNYVITTAFIGNGVELLRLPELLVNLWKRSKLKHKSETFLLNEDRAYAFEYGQQYAWMLTIVATTITFSIVCPLISIFGLIYLAIKHYVDKYNLYYACKQSNLDRECHKSAIRYVLFSLYLSYISILFFTIFRTNTTHGWFKGLLASPQAIFLSLILLTVIIIKLFFKLCYGANLMETEELFYQKQKNDQLREHQVVCESKSSVSSFEKNDVDYPKDHPLYRSSSFYKLSPTVHRDLKYVPFSIYKFLFYNKTVPGKSKYINKLGLWPSDGSEREE